MSQPPSKANKGDFVAVYVDSNIVSVGIVTSVVYFTVKGEYIYMLNNNDDPVFIIEDRISLIKTSGEMMDIVERLGND